MESLASAASSACSSANRQMFFGCQTRRNSSVAIIETTPAAMQEAGNGQALRHAKGANRYEDRGCGAGEGAKMRPHLQARQQTKQDNKRKRRYQCGKPPMTRRVINLCPSHRRTFMLRWLRYFLTASLSRNKSYCNARNLFTDVQGAVYDSRKVARRVLAARDNKPGRSAVRMFAVA